MTLGRKQPTPPPTNQIKPIDDLFDLDEATVLCAGDDDGLNHPPRSDWNEISLATFLAWTDGEQLAYCAARDEDAAAHADDPEDVVWFTVRAARYRQRIKELTT